MWIEIIAMHLDHPKDASDLANEYIVEMNAVCRSSLLAKINLDRNRLISYGMSTLPNGHL